MPVYKRILIKISGEALAGESGFGLSDDSIANLVEQIKTLNSAGVEIGVVIGGGNFWRGRQGTNMDRSTADHMGMLATAINALALQDALEQKKYDRISYMEVIKQELKALDTTAISMCKENKIPILVFDGRKPCGIVNAVEGRDVGTVIE